jgi:uncharacterized protein YbjQ (UPF0145 family)
MEKSKGGKVAMILVNTEEIPGKEIVETLGMVKGSTIRAKHLGNDILAFLRHLVGGELKEYTQMMNEAREIALQMMKKEAEELGADAIINIRFTTSSIMQGASEMLVYGTAVKIKKD